MYFMDFQQLVYFIHSAELRSFTKAAERLFVSQTAISQQIFALECSLKVKLFNRTKRGVELTSAGKILYQEAKKIVELNYKAEEKMKQVALGYQGFINIGKSFYDIPFLPELLRTFKKKHPRIHINLNRDNLHKLNQDLENGLIDIAFTSRVGIEEIEGVAWRIIKKIPIYAILYKGHPLANRKSIFRSELANECIIAIDREESTTGYDEMIAHCLKSGFSPNICYESKYLEVVLLLIEAGFGVALLPGGFEKYGGKNLKFVPLENDYYVELVAAWMTDNSNPALELFLDDLSTIISVYKKTNRKP